MTIKPGRAGKTTPKTAFSDLVGKKAARKVKANALDKSEIWFGLGMMGLVGWSVVVPTLLGVALGLWLDKAYPGGHSYTLALLMAGLCLGSFNAWRWLSKEHQSIQQQNEDDTP
jgi:ATP synthase protein I